MHADRIQELGLAGGQHAMSRSTAAADGVFVGLLRRMNVSRRLIVFFLIVIILPYACVATYAGLSTNEMNRSIVNGAEQVMSKVATTVNDKLQVYESLATQMVNSPSIRDLLTRANAEWAAGGGPAYEQDRAQLEVLLAQYYLVCPNCGMTIATQDNDYSAERPLGSFGLSRLKLRDPSSFFEGAWYEQAVSARGSPVWIDTSKTTESLFMQYSPSNPAWPGSLDVDMTTYLTLLCAPPYAQAFHGVIIIVIPILTTLSSTSQLHNMYDPSEMVLLLSPSGIVSVLSNNVFLNLLPSPSIVQDLVKGPQGARVLDNNGIQQFYVTVPLGKMNMTVAYVASDKRVHSATNNLTTLTVIVAGSCLLVGLIAMFLITLSIARPVRRLEDVMSRAADEQMNITYQDSGRDEIGRLGVMFNSMLGRTRTLISSLVASEQLRHAEESQRREAEFEALQMQMNPHFLYNTLDLIRWNTMRLEDGLGTTSQMITEFSKLMRAGSRNTGQSATMREELEHVRTYLNVINFRQGCHVELVTHVDPEELLDATTVRFMLQPIVENSVLHGLRDQAEGVVRIDIRRGGEQTIRVVIEDNGAGMTRGQLRTLRASLASDGAHPEQGVALRNLSERIKLRLGPSCRIFVDSEAGAYTRVTLLIPWAPGSSA